MTQGAQDAGGGFGAAAGGNASRGILVIVAAVLVGLVLLKVGMSDSDATADEGQSTVAASGETADDPTGTATTAAGDPSAPVEEVTTTVDLGVARAPGEVAVLVLNGTDGPVTGVAGKGRDKLKTEAYTTRSPKNAKAPSPSAVYYTPGFEPEAIAVAEVLGADPALVVQPLDPATVPIDDTQEADIVVVVGNDGVIVV